MKRNKQTVLEAATKISRRNGKWSPAVTMFRHGDGPGYTTTLIGSMSDNQKNSARKESLDNIEAIGGEPVFSILPNNGDYHLQLGNL
jgi:hypothetical protein